MIVLRIDDEKPCCTPIRKTMWTDVGNATVTNGSFLPRRTANNPSVNHQDQSDYVAMRCNTFTVSFCSRLSASRTQRTRFRALRVRLARRARPATLFFQSSHTSVECSRRMAIRSRACRRSVRSRLIMRSGYLSTECHLYHSCFRRPTPRCPKPYPTAVAKVARRITLMRCLSR
jgi:hypothetical protein